MISGARGQGMVIWATLAASESARGSNKPPNALCASFMYQPGLPAAVKCCICRIRLIHGMLLVGLATERGLIRCYRRQNLRKICRAELLWLEQVFPPKLAPSLLQNWQLWNQTYRVARPNFSQHCHHRCRSVIAL